jgi:hypothetical protein
VIINHSAKRTWWLKSLFRFVRVVEVPNIRLLGHVGWHLLEPELSVGSAHTHLRGRLRVPADLCNGAFDVVWVLENHNSLRVDVFRQVLRLLSFEVFLK